MISHETFNMICWIWIAVAVIIFPILLKVTQPYGRHSKNNWGPMINNRFGWFFMEFPSLAIFGYFLCFQSKFVKCACSGTCIFMDVALYSPCTDFSASDKDSQKENTGINCTSCFHF